MKIQIFGFITSHCGVSFIGKLVFSLSWLQVSRLGYGCAGLSYNTPHSDEVGCSIIKEVFNRGITFFDTSDLYGENHHNEIVVCKVLFSVYFEVLTWNVHMNYHFELVQDQINTRICLNIFVEICGNSFRYLIRGNTWHGYWVTIWR